MANRHGDFIWYELMTRDPRAAQAFYADVVGWTPGQPVPGDVDYRTFAAGDAAVGGMLRLTDEMCEGGARPVWLGYVGVDDVDAAMTTLERLGGTAVMPARDVPGVGRIAMAADPLGAPFYIMRAEGAGAASTAFEPATDGHCAWNELATTDPASALSFYSELFGWTSNEAMPMGEAGDYRILEHRGTRVGAVSPHLGKGRPPAWLYYFRVADIDAATAAAEARGAKVLVGPHEVPGGDRIVVGADPEGVAFSLVGAQRG